MAQDFNFGELGGQLGRIIGALAGTAIGEMAREHGGARFGREAGNGTTTLEELDLSREAPRDVTLLGDADLVVMPGKRFSIGVEGAGAPAARFRQSDAGLTISRAGPAGDRLSTTITLTLPDLRRLTVAGSGQVKVKGIAADRLAIRIAGTGRVKLKNCTFGRLDAALAGAGRIDASGKADRIALTLAGAGRARMKRFVAGRAEVHLAGAGRATFACDGDVDAKLLGAGQVRVIGRATCSVQSIGAGRVVCEPA